MSRVPRPGTPRPDDASSVTSTGETTHTQGGGGAPAPAPAPPTGGASGAFHPPTGKAGTGGANKGGAGAPAPPPAEVMAGMMAQMATLMSALAAGTAGGAGDGRPVALPSTTPVAMPEPAVLAKGAHPKDIIAKVKEVQAYQAHLRNNRVEPKALSAFLGHEGRNLGIVMPEGSDTEDCAAVLAYLMRADPEARKPFPAFPVNKDVIRTLQAIPPWTNDVIEWHESAVASGMSPTEVARAMEAALKTASPRLCEGVDLVVTATRHFTAIVREVCTRVYPAPLHTLPAYTGLLQELQASAARRPPTVAGDSGPPAGGAGGGRDGDRDTRRRDRGVDGGRDGSRRDDRRGDTRPPGLPGSGRPSGGAGAGSRGATGGAGRDGKPPHPGPGPAFTAGKPAPSGGGGKPTGTGGKPSVGGLASAEAPEPATHEQPDNVPGGGWAFRAEGLPAWSALARGHGSTAPLPLTVTWDSGNYAQTLIHGPVAARMQEEHGARVTPCDLQLKSALAAHTPIRATQQMELTVSWTTRVRSEDGSWRTDQHEVDVVAAITDTSGFGADLVIDGTLAGPVADTHVAMINAQGYDHFQFRVPPNGPLPRSAQMAQADVETVALPALLPRAASHRAAADAALILDHKTLDQMVLPGQDVAIPAADLMAKMRLPDTLTPEQRSRLSDIIERHLVVFQGGVSRTPSDVVSLGHRMAVPAQLAGRRVPQRLTTEQVELATSIVNEQVEAGVLRRLSPEEAKRALLNRVIITSNHTGKPRMVVDLRIANMHAGPMDPRTGSVEVDMAAVRRNCFRAVVDISKAYFTMGVAPEEQLWLAFSLGGGVFAYTRAPFGHVNSGVTFEEKLNGILPRDLHAVTMVDDILLQAKSWGQLMSRLDRLLAILAANNMRVGADKVQIVAPGEGGGGPLHFLGYEVGDMTRTLAKRRLDPIVNATLPTTLAGWRRFVGVAVAASSVLPHAAAPLATLRPLLAKESKHAATEEQRAAFEQIRVAARTPVALTHLSPSDPLDIYTDASGTAMGVVVLQDDHVVAMFQRAFTKAESSMSAVDKEAAGLLYAAHACGHMIRQVPAILHTDAKNLAPLDNHTVPKMQRIAVQLMRFPHLRIRHVDGVRNVVADALSRMELPTPDEEEAPPVGAISRARKPRRAEPEDESDEEGEGGGEAAPAQAGTLAAPAAPAPSADDLLPRIVAAQASMPEDARKQADRAYGLTETTRGDLTVLESHGRIFIPAAATELQQELLRRFHDAQGHRGKKRTAEDIRRGGVWWPNLEKTVAAWCEACTTCVHLHAPHGRIKNTQLRPTPLPPEPMHTVTADYLTLPTASGTETRYLLVLQDQLTNYLRLHPATEATANVTLAGLRSWIDDYGLMDVFVTDGGSHFNNEAVADFCKRNGITHHIGPAYAPWTMGKNERSHREVRKLFQSAVGSATAFWDRRVQTVQSLYNDSHNDALGCSPFEALFGRKRRTAIDAELRHTRGQGLETAAEWPELLKTLHERAKAHQEAVARDRVAAYSKDVKEVTFKEGDYVTRYDPRKVDSLGYHYRELYKVEKVLPERSVCMVRNLVMDHVSEAHMNHLRHVNLSRSSEAAELAKQLPPTHLVVDEVLGHRLDKSGKVELHVSWQKTGELDWAPTWEPAANMAKVAKATEYLTKHRLKAPDPPAPAARTAKGRPKRAKGRGAVT